MVKLTHGRLGLRRNEPTAEADAMGETAVSENVKQENA